MDGSYLALQNLKSEKSHLEKEIEMCEQFETEYEELLLHPEEEFVMLADTEGVQIPDRMMDAHGFMLARLRFELSERQRLDLEKKSLVTTKAKLVEAVLANKAKVEILEKLMNDSINSLKTIQERLKDF